MRLDVAVSKLLDGEAVDRFAVSRELDGLLADIVASPECHEALKAQLMALSEQADEWVAIIDRLERKGT
jgi:hypothetical protein